MHHSFKGRLSNKPILVKDRYILAIDLGKQPKLAYDLCEEYANQPLMVTVDKYREKRSADANNLLWQCIQKLADALELSNYDAYTRELRRYGKCENYLVKKEALPELQKLWRFTEIIDEYKNQDGEDCCELLCFYGTSNYNTKEFSRLLNGVISDLKDIGIYVEY